MFCNHCGKQISSDQTFCPNCGIRIQKDISVNNTIDVNQPSNSIGFNRNSEQDLEQLNNSSLSSSYQNVGVNNVLPRVNKVVSSGPDTNVPVGMQMPINNKKKFPWIPIAIVLVIIMVIGMVFFPDLNKFIFKTYQNNEYSLKYNYNWSLDSEADGLVLYYSDNFSSLTFNASTNFSDFSYKLNDERTKKMLYKIFYDVWSDTKGIELKGGTSTFLDLENNSVYARIDYTYLSDSDKIGAFYVVINEEYDSVISFIATSIKTEWEKVNNDIVSMLESIEYIGDTVVEKMDKEYAKFDAGAASEFSALGYMDYYVPDSFSYDESRSLNNQYRSNIFAFKDGYSMLDIKASTVYDATTNISGTNYEKMKSSIVKAHGELKDEDTKVFNGVTWYHIVTNDYVSKGKDFYNEIYFTLSDSGRHLYYLEAYIYKEGSEAKQKYIKKGIDYILNSITLYKFEE